MSKDPYNPMDMKALLCFEAMARHESLTQASIELGISDAAVSQRIRSLEKYLGTKLYEARGGKVRLTETGNRTRALATRIFDELAEFEDEIRDEEYRGTITISTLGHICRYQLPDIVRAFRKEYQHAKLRLLTREIPETIELVRRNDVDLGIISQWRSTPPEVVFYPWRTFKVYLLIPRGHPLVRRKVPKLHDILNEETLSHYPQVVPLIDRREDRLRDALKQLDLPFNVSMEVGDIESVKHYAAQCRELAVVNGACLSREDEANFHIIEVPKEFEHETVYGVIIRRDKYVPSALRTLLSLLGVEKLGK